MNVEISYHHDLHVPIKLSEFNHTFIVQVRSADGVRHTSGKSNDGDVSFRVIF